MSLANKFGIPQGLLDAAKAALEEANEYQKKVQAHMAKKGIKSMNDMTPDQKKKFFNELDAMHKAKNEEVEPVEEAESHQAKTTMKHIKNPTQGEKDASKKMKSGIPGYRDRIAMLHSAKARGALKNEDVELTQEDLDFIASLNETQDVSLDDFTVEEIEEYMQTEEFAQLDELSKETLGSYVKKRSHDVATQGALTRKHAMDSEAKKKETGGYTTKAVRDLDDKANRAFMKGWKHRQNIARAVDKIVNKA